MIKFLVIQDLHGESGLQNVGIFLGTEACDAEFYAQKQWHTKARLIVHRLAALPDGWSYGI